MQRGVVGFAEQINSSSVNAAAGGGANKKGTRSPGGKGGGKGARSGGSSHMVMDDAFGIDEQRLTPSSNVCHARFFNGEFVSVVIGLLMLL